MERKVRTLLTAVLLLSATACGTKDPGEEKVDLAVTIAKEIAESPAKADEIVKKHGMTNQEYQKLVFEITGDEKLAELYKRKLGR